VNDAPAIKAADIGIAMGMRGTDVAREAAALVLTDDAFSSIVRAVRAGRRIYDNLKKAMAYILAVHVPIAVMSLLPVVVPNLGGKTLPLVLLPMHIAFLELIIDPSCSIVFEAQDEESGIMDRPPRGLGDPLFSRRMITLSLVQGFVVALAVVAVYLTAVLSGLPDAVARTCTFVTLVVGNLGLIFVNRSWTDTVLSGLRSRNAALWIVTGGTLGVLSLLLAFGPARGLFRFGALSARHLALAVIAGLLSVVWFEVYKALARRRRRSIG
jgi:Ca2+-transporting ATPase